MINTLLGLVIDPDTMRPVLGGVTGGLSGPAIRPVALRCVWQVHQALPDVPDPRAWAASGAGWTRCSSCSPGRRRSRWDGGVQRPVRARRGSTTSWPPRWRERGFASPAEAVGLRAPATRMSGPVRAAPRRRRRRPRPAVRGHRPARAAAGEVGAARTSPDGLARFTDAVVDALAGSVAVLKPQIAFYERHGSRGLAVLEDGRRAGPAPPVRWCCWTPSAATSARPWTPTPTTCVPDHPLRRRRHDGQPLSRPGLAAAGRRHRRALHGGGLFVLARTSNPDAGTLQHALVGERSVAQASSTPSAAGTPRAGWSAIRCPTSPSVRDLASRFGADAPAPSASSSAPRCASWTSTSTGWAVRSSRRGSAPRAARSPDLRRLFGTGRAVVPTVSRDVLAAGPDSAALRAAADRWTAELAG